MFAHAFEFDAFICHASEDKDAVARPLATALIGHGRKIWFDEMTLRIGDSLRRKIDEGLSKSRYGIVILSQDFFAKQWTQYELDGLLSREMADAAKVILPVWHGVTASDVRRYSLPLSMRLAGNTVNGIENLAGELQEIIGPADIITVPEIADELSLAKQAILTEALADQSRIYLNPSSLSSGRAVILSRYALSDSEKQRKLFLYALDELADAGLVEALADSYYELTYLGIQAAERMTRLSNEDLVKLGLT